MVKNLRSFIHEKFTLDLRVELDILSRRRDIINEEKQDELLKLLRKYEIPGISQLGPGTNRYAIRLDGFVVKFATDHDGKIDNMKEFKMAKRLFPYVSKVYEVSKNGTIMIAEYIQPFDSYSEMCHYADQIREILRKISAVYLIGDVGISSVNFGNWGIRVGTDDPVCFDFAYVYEVKSELFVCRYCNSMLVPDKDFNDLYCSNPACQKKYTFEDIRARIGNDIHKHEIGDLSEEGYLMDRSNIVTELTPQRSNYLLRKKDIKVEQKKEEDIIINYDPFVMDHSPKYYIDNDKEDKTMAKNVIGMAEVATGYLNDSRSKDPYDDFVINVVGTATVVGEATPVSTPKEEKKNSSEDEVVFSASIVDVTEISEEPKEEQPVEAVVIEEVHEELEETVVDKSNASENYTGTEATVNVTEVKVAPVEAPAEEKKDNHKPQKEKLFSTNFMTNSYRAISKLSNMIGEYLHILDAFSTLKGYINTGKGKKQIYPEELYKNIQNAIFKSLAAFCNFNETEIQTQNGPKKVLQPSKFSEGNPYNPTLKFIDRIWNDRDISTIENPQELLEAYHNKYDDYLGIQKEWIDIFKARMIEKRTISKAGADMVINFIYAWIAEDPVEIEEPKEEQPVEAVVIEEVHEEPEVEQEEEPQVNDEEEVAFGAVIDSNPEQEEDDEGEEEGEAESIQYVTVEVFPEGTFDIVKVTSQEAYGTVTIPFYTNLNKVDMMKDTVYMNNDKNGLWDWLACLAPDMMFQTKDPDYWMKENNIIEEEKPYIIILDENEGLYTMGIYYVNGMYIINGDGEFDFIDDEETIFKIGRVIVKNIGWSDVSHIKRTIDMAEDVMVDEEYVKRSATGYTEETDDEDDEDEEDDSEGENQEQSCIMTAQELAAIAAMTSEETANELITGKQQVPVDQIPIQTSSDVLPVIRRRQ